MHLWDNGKTTVLINDADKRLNAACLIDAIAFGSRFAKTKRTLTQTLSLLHDPHLLMLQILRLEHGQLAPTALREIDHETLCVERHFKDALTRVSADGNTRIEMSQQQFAKHHVGLHLADGEFHGRITFHVMTDELGQDVWRDGRTDGECQFAINGSLVFSHKFRNAFCFSQRLFCLTDNLLASRCRSDEFVAALEDAHIEFFFQFHKHGTERRL